MFEDIQSRDVTGNALDTAFDFQLKAIVTQVKFEVKAETLKEQEQDRRDRENKAFWTQIALIIALGYASAK